jgi:hypothetical protein
LSSPIKSLDEKYQLLDEQTLVPWVTIYIRKYRNSRYFLSPSKIDEQVHDAKRTYETIYFYESQIIATKIRY